MIKSIKLFFLAIIWIQSRFCKFNEKIFQQALRKLSDIPNINDMKWNKFGSADCCLPYESESKFEIGTGSGSSVTEFWSD